MFVELEVRKIGNSLGVILPKEVTNHLHVQEGDKIYLTQDISGARVVSNNPNFKEAMVAFEEFRRDYRDALHELASK